MAKIVWGQPGTKTYEMGISHGVLYLPNNTAVPWNGLTSIEETFSDDTNTPVYIDGIKYVDIPSIGDFEATLSAITYPDQFEQFDGSREIAPGLFVDDQTQGRFGLSYRTLVGNDIEGQAGGYKIHILYNLSATSTDRNYATVADTVESDVFSWSIAGIPVALTGYRPTVHVILDSAIMNPLLLADAERYLYGTDTEDPRMPTLAELKAMLEYLIRIVDNGDGTWTATGPDALFTVNPDGSFEIREANVAIIDATTYSLSDTPA